MIGTPKWFNTKQDVLNSIMLDRQGTLDALAKLYENRFITKDLGVYEGGDLPDGCFTAPVKPMESDTEEIHVFQQVEDPNARIWQLLTPEEYEQLRGA